MPNWCMNTVLAKHSDPAKMEAMKESLKKEIFFDHVLPLGEWDYEKAIQTWGTKWEASDISWMHFNNDPNSPLDISFSSAWCAPEEVYKKMVDDGWQITAYFYEPGMGFVGKFGVDLDGFYEEYFEMDEPIPAELVEMFNMQDMYDDSDYELVHNGDGFYVVQERIAEEE